MSTVAAPRLTPPPGGYPPFPELLPAGMIEHGRYRVRFARRADELDSVLRLRYRVFNLELGEGLAASAATGRDEDAFDAACHHLLVEDVPAGTVIGTYRMQTAAMAAAGRGFYSAGEFDLAALPPEVVASAMEVGRACIAREHRNRQVLFLLWKGLARYLTATGARYLFGCCSLTSQDPAEGLRVMAHLAGRGLLHPGLRVDPLPGLGCAAGEAAAAAEADPAAIELPSLFRTYLRYGALVCGPPAIDREFKTIDFLVLLDSEALDRRSRALFFG
jgi:putative hemolysin